MMASLCKMAPDLACDFENKLKEAAAHGEDDAQSGQTISALLEMLKHELISRNLISARDSKKDDSILKACRYISEHLEEDFSYQDVAEFVHLSPRHFIRRFKSEMGENFSDYIIKMRIEAAKQMAKEGKVRLSDIGEKVGYRSDKYFQHLFKQYTGYSLADYQRREK